MVTILVAAIIALLIGFVFFERKELWKIVKDKETYLLLPFNILAAWLMIEWAEPDDTQSWVTISVIGLIVIPVLTPIYRFYIDALGLEITKKTTDS